MGGWAIRMFGECEYHVSTVAGGRLVGYVTRNDADEWVAGTYDREGNGTPIGSGYASLHEAKMAVDAVT